MATSTFGILAAFDHNIQTWETYKCRLSQWFIANDIDRKTDSTGIKRRAILLSALSDSTHKLAADLALPKLLQDVPYDDILTLLDGHFTPKRCGFGERYKFYAATQQPAETYAQWAARLRGSSAHCGFLNVEEALRDRFVMGMIAGPEKDKLFAQDLKDLTLAKAVELADSVSSARAGAAAAARPVHDQLFRIEPARRRTDAPTASVQVQKVQCQVCGFYNHDTSQCRFSKYKCKKCNSTGHLRRMCKKINYVASSAVEEGGDDDGECFNIRSVKGEPMTETVSISGIELKVEIDSGSAVTAISEGTFKKYFSHVPLSATKKRLFSYTGGRIDCIGEALLTVSYAGYTHTLNVCVIRNGGPPIVGRDFIALFKLELQPIRYCAQTVDDSVLMQLQSRYSDVFSDKLGQFKKYKVTLQLKENAKPVFIRARPIAFALKDKVDKEIDRLLTLGVLKPVDHARYASPIVPVLKRNGSIRICADYSTGINKQLIIDQYPLPTVTELFAKLHGGQQFTKLDLSNAYNQFVLDDKSQEMTCINTHRGLFKYTRMVFGLASAPAVFQRAMETVLAGTPGTLCLLDDVLITGRDRAEHLQRLHVVLQRLQDAGLTLQKDKCDFFKDEVNYLGYVINKKGINKSPQKVKAMVDAPVPNNVKQLQSFLGLVNYYRKFVPNASAIMCPLYELLKTGTKWCWTPKHDEAFIKIKDCLASEQVLAHFNPNDTPVLTVDASPSGLAAILGQIGPDGSERPISFASRTLNAAEKRYSQIQKEATAIIFGVRRYHQYLYGRAVPFILRTDHKPLLSIFGPYRGIPEVTANRLQRYAMFLSGYNYRIEYVKSADNSADFLSRVSLPEAPETPEGEGDMRCADAGAAILDRASYVNFVVEGSLPVTLEQLREETSKDVTLNKVITFVFNGWPKKTQDINLKPYHACRLQLSVENGCLMRGHKVVIPTKLQNAILTELHQSHLGIVKTKAEARSRVWFPKIDVALERMIGSCDVCIQMRPTPARAPIAHWDYPPQPFYRVHIDFLGPINGCTHLIVVDAYSKWVEVYNMKCATTSTATIERLYDFMSRFGIPHTLVSDNGTSFTSREFESFCKLNGISHVTSPAYHPASNGQAESFVKVIKKGIRTSILSGHGVHNANNKLLKYLFDYRNSVHTTTGFSPAGLVYGRKLRTRLDQINPTSPPPSCTTLANVVKNNQCSQNKLYKNTQCFSEGTKILYKKYTFNGKFTWCKGVIVKKIGKVVYAVKDIVTLLVLRKHKNQIVLYKGKHCFDVNSRDVDLGVQSPNLPSGRQSAVSGERQAQFTAGEETQQTTVESASPGPAKSPTVLDEDSTGPEMIEERSSPMPWASDQAENDEFQDAVSSLASEPPSVVPGPPTVDMTASTSGRPKRNIPTVNYKLYF